MSVASPDIFSRNNIHVSGQGERALVFVHGFGCDQSMWRYVTPAFESDYKVVVFDLVGSGRSDLSAFDRKRYSSLEGYAQDILEVVEALALKDVTVIGHSVSGILGAIAAIRQPEAFSKLIMVGPSPCYINYPPDYIGGFDRADIEEMLDLMDKNCMGWASFLAPMAMQNIENPELSQELEDSFCSTDPITARIFAKATFYSDYRALLPKVKIPCLIMQCSEDAIAPDEVGDYMHRHLANSSFVKMSATGHCPHVSHPQETTEIIRRYLSTV